MQQLLLGFACNNTFSCYVTANAFWSALCDSADCCCSHLVWCMRSGFSFTPSTMILYLCNKQIAQRGNALYIADGGCPLGFETLHWPVATATW